MKKTLSVIGVVAFALMATIALAGPPDMIKIDKAMDKKAAVEFPHAKHVEVAESCTVCHHTNEGLTMEMADQVQPCSECHLNPEGDVPDMAQMSLKKNPFHMQCIDCHKEMDKGPKTCNECHPKE
jgi:hypothetical protein